MIIRRNDKGFTLVELFISTAIIFLVGAVVYSIFFNAVNVWRRASISRKLEKDVAINLTKIARDVRNSFEFSSIPFEGAENYVSFAGLVPMAASSGGSGLEVGRIMYFFDKDKTTLFKEEKRYPQVFKESGTEEDYTVPVITDVSDMVFSYCYLDNLTGEYKWKDDWKIEDQDSIPQAVKLDLVFKKDGRETSRVSKTIFMPMGTGEQRKELGSSSETTQ